jgi:hypothetical protein
MQQALSVSQVAQMQVNSPDFADWCITHVSDHHYDYLFSKASPRRHEYEAALVEQRRLAATTASVGGAKHLAPQMTAAQPAVNPNAPHCTIPAPTATSFCGPHQPYALVGTGKAAFEDRMGKLNMIHPATVGPNTQSAQAVTTELVEYMTSRKTKTETMVHRIVAGLGGLGVQKRIENFYLLSSVFYEHRNAAEPGRKVPYMGVFDRYMPEALRLSLFLCKPNVPEVA